MASIAAGNSKEKKIAHTMNGSMVCIAQREKMARRQWKMLTQRRD